MKNTNSRALECLWTSTVCTLITRLEEPSSLTQLSATSGLVPRNSSNRCLMSLRESQQSIPLPPHALLVWQISLPASPAEAVGQQSLLSCQGNWRRGGTTRSPLHEHSHSLTLLYCILLWSRIGAPRRINSSSSHKKQDRCWSLSLSCWLVPVVAVVPAAYQQWEQAEILHSCSSNRHNRNTPSCSEGYQ